MFAVIFIPDFFLQAALRHEPELFSQPIALLDEPFSKTVFQLTPAARAQSVSEGLTSTQALARCPQLIFRNRSAAQESAATELLLQSAYSFSPSIEATAPGICTLDLQGLTLPEEKAWGEKIAMQLASLHLRAQIGIAENPELALQAARMAQPVFVVENSRQFISRLPVESIEPPEEISGILRRWGIHTLGDFVALGKDKLAERLGSEALELFDRASANSIRPLDVVQPKNVFEEAMEFENGIETLQPLLFVLRRFIEQLSLRLELFYLVAQEIQLNLKLSSGEKLERSFRVPSPTRNIETLFRMLQTHLETLQTESPIVALHLAAKPGKPEHFQFGLFETALRDPNHFYETLAQLTSLLGADRVGTPVVENSFRPDAFRMEPVNFDVLPTFSRRNSSEQRSESSTLNSSGRMSSALSLRRFRPPLPAIVEMRGGLPSLLNSEQFVGAVSHADGPFRSSGHWWEPKQLWSRDEWDIETADGNLFRIFEHDGDWFLEGSYD